MDPLRRPLRAFAAALTVLAIGATAAPAGAHSGHRHASGKARYVSHPDPARAFPKRGWPRRARSSALDPAFSTAWDCTPTTTDTGDAFSNAPQIKVVYAFANDRTNHLITLDIDGDIQSDVKAIRDRMAGETAAGATQRSVRFDLGAACPATVDPLKVDIQTVQLPNALSFYNTGVPGQTFSRLRTDIESALDAVNVKKSGRRRNLLVYADEIVSGTASGEAQISLDDSAGSGNDGNQGDLVAAIYNPTSWTDDQRRATFLHELSHNLGAVHDSAPHSSGLGHCYDESDIMCYDDGGSNLPSGDVVQVCAALVGFAELYDCNNDDYFDPTPSGNSSFTTHWNLYDSVFLCDVTVCDSSLTAPAVTLTKSGKTLRGNTITYSVAVSSGTVTRYEWDMNDDGFFERDTGSTPSTTLQNTSNGSKTVRVRASAANGTFDSESVTFSVTEPVTPTPDLQITPQNPVTGETVTLDGSGTQDPDGVITAYTWDLDGDGTFETNTGLNPVTTTSFATAGTHQIGFLANYPLGNGGFTAGIPVAQGPDTGGGGGTPTTPTTTPGTAGTPGTTGTTGATPGGTTFSPLVSIAAVRRAALLAKGLPITVTCQAACKLTAVLTLDARTAKRLKLKTKIGSLSVALQPGKRIAVLKLTRAAKKALKKSKKKVSAKLGVSIPGTPAFKLTKKLSF